MPDRLSLERHLRPGREPSHPAAQETSGTELVLLVVGALGRARARHELDHHGRLSRQGFAVETARDGLEALRLIEETEAAYLELERQRGLHPTKIPVALEPEQGAAIQPTEQV